MAVVMRRAPGPARDQRPAAPGRIVVRLLAAALLAGLLGPRPVQAGGDMGKGPYDVGEKYFARRDYPTALKFYRRAAAQSDARALYRMGLIAEDAGRERDALEQYRRFLEGAPAGAERSDAARRAGAIEARLQGESARSVELLEEGKRLFGEGKYREAEGVLLQAVARDEAAPEAHFYLGEVYMKLEAYARAASEYDKAKGFY